MIKENASYSIILHKTILQIKKKCKLLKNITPRNIMNIYRGNNNTILLWTFKLRINFHDMIFRLH